ncbi:MAG: L,D-transpeptidase family protein [Magnetococcales bacterium]|nr:L,D-transpeptidase family protein [Magnetococcales bacterium]
MRKLLFILSALLAQPFSIGYAQTGTPLKLEMETQLSEKTARLPLRTWMQPQPGEEIIGPGLVPHVMNTGDHIVELARIFDLGFYELVDANPDVNPWVPIKGTRLQVSQSWILPNPLTVSEKSTKAANKAGRVDNNKHGTLIINLAERRLYYRNKAGSVATFPVGIGRAGYATPKGYGKIVRKQAAPTWYVPQSILDERPEQEPIVPPGPENPLGTHALYLSIPGYLIHGTNKPYGIGRRVSHGCIRLYPEDILWLFDHAYPGDKVMIVEEPVKAGWRDGLLYLEVHPVLEESMGSVDWRELAFQVVNQALARYPSQSVQLDWNKVDQMIVKPNGVPQVVGKPVVRPNQTGLKIDWRLRKQPDAAKKSTTTEKKAIQAE